MPPLVPYPPGEALGNKFHPFKKWNDHIRTKDRREYEIQNGFYVLYHIQKIIGVFFAFGIPWFHVKFYGWGSMWNALVHITNLNLTEEDVAALYADIGYSLDEHYPPNMYLQVSQEYQRKQEEVFFFGKSSPEDLDFDEQPFTADPRRADEFGAEYKLGVTAVPPHFKVRDDNPPLILHFPSSDVEYNVEAARELLALIPGAVDLFNEQQEQPSLFMQSLHQPSLPPPRSPDAPASRLPTPPPLSGDEEDMEDYNDPKGKAASRSISALTPLPEGFEMEMEDAGQQKQIVAAKERVPGPSKQGQPLSKKKKKGKGKSKGKKAAGKKKYQLPAGLVKLYT
ncbi:hypothetical protein BDZ89DRAFT_1231100 [Hymenopellis radicata]|nr:hypothetical protein BDZ89DRAFT_1231100 [Hymenopellis radicata]